MTDKALSPQQLAVICALSNGATMTAAAEEAGIHRNTIANWRRNVFPFQQALADAQYERALFFREKCEDLVDLAIQTLREILTNPDDSPSVRLKAALAVINTAAKPPEPKKQIMLEVQKVAFQNSAPPVHTNAQSEIKIPPAPMHNSAQQPFRPPPVTSCAKNKGTL